MNPFQIMSEPIRRRIIEILALGEHTSGNIADVIMSEQEESAHFYYLEDRVWRRLDAEVKHLKRLWKRRIGALSGNDSFAQFKNMKDVRPYPRGVEGTVKGLRGRVRRNDPWARQVRER